MGKKKNDIIRGNGRKIIEIEENEESSKKETFRTRWISRVKLLDNYGPWSCVIITEISLEDAAKKNEWRSWEKEKKRKKEKEK